MSIYQPRRKTWPVLLAVVVAAAGGIATGWLLWGRRPPDPIEALAVVNGTLAQAADAVDVVAAHAEFAEGEATPSYAGSLAALDRAKSLYGEAAPVVRATNPEVDGQIETAFSALKRKIEERASPKDVREEAERLASSLRAVLHLTNGQAAGTLVP